MTLVQSQSAASIRIETAINKTITDFNTAMDRQNTAILRGLNIETVLFEKDAKTAISFMVLTSYYVTSYGVNPSAASYLAAASELTTHVTEANTAVKEKISPEKLATDVKVVIDDYKSKVDTAVTELREKMKSELETNPNSQACYEKLIKDINALSTSATKNVTDSFNFATKDFKGKAKVAHANINTNVTVVLKNSYGCIGLRRADFVFTCTDKFILDKDKAKSFVDDRKAEIEKIYEENTSNLAVQGDKIGENITAQKDAISTKIDGCSSADMPGVGKADPEITAEVTPNV